MTDPRSRREKIRRRTISIGGLAAATFFVTVMSPLVLLGALASDVVRAKFRLPALRLTAFGICWCWIELAGVLRAFGLWLTGRAGDDAANYRVMGWWAGTLMRALTATTGLRPEIEGRDQLAAGDAVVLARHASLGDSLLSGWATATELRLHPRYVLKKSLLYDPCLDVVGLRIPNHFLDRSAADGSGELDALRALTTGIGPGSCGVIFTEGTRANPTKRARALDKIGERDPGRAARLHALKRLLPPRIAGSKAMIEGAPDADVVFAWHTGFDGLDSFSGMLDKLSKPLTPVRFVLRRVPRGEVPNGDAFGPWLDEQWLRMDAEVDAALSAGVTSPP